MAIAVSKIGIGWRYKFDKFCRISRKSDMKKMEVKRITKQPQRQEKFVTGNTTQKFVEKK